MLAVYSIIQGLGNWEIAFYFQKYLFEIAHILTKYFDGIFQKEMRLIGNVWTVLPIYLFMKYLLSRETCVCFGNITRFGINISGLGSFEI